MRLLRDVREATELLLLLEVTTHRHTRMKSLADKLGLSVQAVSGYVREMTEAGLVSRQEGVYTATVRGVDRLHEGFKELRDFVDRSYAEMSILERTPALAGADVREGDRVGLIMEDGVLVAYPGREAASRGRALHGAREGEDVAIVDLEGIVDLEPGTIVLLRLPGVAQGGTHRVDLEAAREAVRKAAVDRIGAADLVARVLARKLDLPVDFRLAAAPAALEAAQRGLDVLLLVSEDAVPDVVAAVEAANEGREEKVRYEVRDLGSRGDNGHEK